MSAGSAFAVTFTSIAKRPQRWAGQGRDMDSWEGRMGWDTDDGNGQRVTGKISQCGHWGNGACGTADWVRLHMCLCVSG